MRFPGQVEMSFAAAGEGSGQEAPAAAAAPSSPSPPPAPSGTAPASPAPAPAPSAAPSTPSPAAPSPEAPVTPEPFDFAADGLGSVFDVLSGGDEPPVPRPTPLPEVVPQPAAPAAAKPPEPAKPAVAPAAPAPAAVAAPPAAAVPATGQQEPPSAVAPSAPQAVLDPADPMSLAAAMANEEPAMIEHLAQSVFKLSPEDIEELETNVVVAIPKLLAKAMVKMQQSNLMYLGRSLPAMLQRREAIIQRNAKNQSKFYEKWKDLKPEVHGDLVNRYGAVFRQMHPSATLEQMIDELGPMVMMAARVTPTVSAPVAAAGTVVAPPAPTNGVRPPPASPFVPAMGGAGSPSLADPAQLGPDWSWIEPQQ